MKINKLMALFIDRDLQHIQLYDVKKEEVVFDGDYADIPEEYDYAKIISIDNLWSDSAGVFTINVDVT